MSLIRTVEPAVLPLTVAEVKANSRVEHSAEDALIETYLRAATGHLDGPDGVLGRALVPQTIKWVLDKFPEDDKPLVIPLPPLIGVTSIAYRDGNSVSQSLSVGTLTKVDGGQMLPSSYIPASGTNWPSTDGRMGAVEVVFQCGYEAPDDSPEDLAANVPWPIKEAILLMAEHWYAHRSAVMSDQAYIVPMTVNSLVAPYIVETFA